jgi:NAD(P)-dependent dehydrogenase (short-subunit alcohol dehydrogenase family)
MRLGGKRALITGAARGIGRTAALRFAAEGAAVAVADINEDGARTVAGEIEQTGGRGVGVGLDVTSAASVEAAFAVAERELDGLDVVFNNAGIVYPDDSGPVETPLDVWERTLAVNLTGVFLCCKFGIAALERAGGGSIVNTASIVAHVGSMYPQIAYTASKGGVLALSRELGVLYARKGIRVNAISPGLTRTELAEVVIQDESFWAKRRPYVPMGRLGVMDEVANVALFLASDEASFVTAQCYLVDGGVSAAYVLRDE